MKNVRLKIRVDSVGRGSIVDMHTGLELPGVVGFTVRAHTEQATTIELVMMADELQIQVEADQRSVDVTK